MYRRLDEALSQYENLHHDVGFMWMHTAVANYRLTGDADARRRGLHAANLLAGRFNPDGRYIVSWNKNRPGWVIVDGMMNIPLLYWASQELNDPRFAQIARAHADVCARVNVRPDGSCHHICVLDTATGELLDTPTGQGYAPGSSWSRGQSWALYGFALSYRHTGCQNYLDVAKSVAHYFIANLALTDWLPAVDFRAPIGAAPHDSSAAMCAACGLLEIACHVGQWERDLYTGAALRILRACEQTFADWDMNTDGLMGGGCVAYHHEGPGLNTPLVYGDYFFCEAILRLLEKDFPIW